ncbi:rod shape-determining protein MreD [Roseomonas sp. SSH11]|uniref:Rod shape-determining protein MreD n=1 Tax=Pararoseomonas baculiformis TaxID=2820812 RepID=A0ABS4ADU9_9PROT|nr:rod shape-determining protein MreD [Pararoseomonas baculiformis]MBP0445156.1 rod shape-determining protein MreD [Pararoseomonas baculiformis]
MARKGRPASAPGLLARLDAMARAAVPTATTVLAMILAAAPVGLPSLVPAVSLAAVFFWSLFRPAAMPAPAAFGLGLLQDLLGFAPLGIGVLTLLLVHAALLRLRRVLAKQSFLLVWLSYCGFASLAVGLGFVLQALLSWQVPPTTPAIAQLGLSIGIYPGLAWLMSWAHRAMERAEALA